MTLDKKTMPKFYFIVAQVLINDCAYFLGLDKIPFPEMDDKMIMTQIEAKMKIVFWPFVSWCVSLRYVNKVAHDKHIYIYSKKRDCPNSKTIILNFGSTLKKTNLLGDRELA